MTIRLRFENNITPIPAFETGYDLMFDLLVLVPEEKVPVWAKQVLTY